MQRLLSRFASPAWSELLASVPRRARRILLVASALTAVLQLLLLVDAALLVELATGAGRESNAGVGIWGRLTATVLQNVDPDRALRVLTAVGIVLAGLQGAAAFWKRRIARRAGADVALQLWRLLFQKARDDVAAWSAKSDITRKRWIDACGSSLGPRAGMWWHVVAHATCVFPLALVVAFSVHVWLALTAVLLAAIGAVVLVQLQRREAARQSVIGDRVEREVQTLAEQFDQVETLESYQMQSLPSESLDDRLSAIRHGLNKREKAHRAVRPLRSVLVLVGAFLLGSIAVFNVLAPLPLLSVGGAAALAGALAWGAHASAVVLRTARSNRRAERTADGLFAFLDAPPHVKDVTAAEPLLRQTGDLRLADVVYQENARQRAIEHLSIDVPAGQRVVIFSEDAAVPDALRNLLLRFADPQAGDVFFDGQNLRFASAADVRREFISVGDDGGLFTASVADNITCGDEQFTRIDVIETARGLGVDPLLSTLPEGYDTLVGPYGMRLRPVEAFAIKLLRAAIRRPAVILIREPSGINGATLAQTYGTLQQMCAGCTLLIVPDAVETVREADRVLFFHEGRLLGDDTHAALLKQSDYYRHLHYLHFNAFREASPPKLRAS